MMGFEEERSRIAWEKAPIKTTEGLINWIENNPEIP